MTLEKLNAMIKMAEENARGNNREGTIDSLSKCYDIIKNMKPQPSKFKTELDALSNIAESLKIISEKR